MPQPIPSENQSWTTAARVLYDKNPQCLAAIGLVATAWTQVEDGLFQLISGALGPANRGDDGGWGLTTNWVVKAALVEAETIRVRIKIADSTYGALIKDSRLDPEWAKAKDLLNRRSRKRNQIVHATYGWSERYPDGLIRVDKNGPLELWTLEDFEAAASQMLELFGMLHQLLLTTLSAIDSKEIVNAITHHIDRLR